MMRRRASYWAVGAAVVALGAAGCNRSEPVRDETTRQQEATPQPEDARRAEGSTVPDAPNEATPAWITTKIQAQYFANPEIKPWNIDVTTTSDGVVTLRGEVDAADDKAEAVRIARATEGVTRVEDRLRVKGEAAAATTGTADRTAARGPDVESPDAWVTSKIQAKYFTDPDVKGLDIDVTTQEGVVTLKGEVETQAERRQAVAIARNTDGVRDVQDQLQLRGGAESGTSGTAGRDAASEGREAGRETAAAIDDTWITTKIQSKYFLDADVKGHEINVDTQNGVVTLSGTVASEAQKRTAEEIAGETRGVSRVENQLTVRQAQGQ